MVGGMSRYIFDLRFCRPISPVNVFSALVSVDVTAGDVLGNVDVFLLCVCVYSSIIEDM